MATAYPKRLDENGWYISEPVTARRVVSTSFIPRIASSTCVLPEINPNVYYSVDYSSRQKCPWCGSKEEFDKWTSHCPHCGGSYD